MAEPKQKYRMTFKCSECGSQFKKITTNRDLMSAPCPECKSREQKTRFTRMGDGPVTDADLLAEKISKKMMETPEFQQALLSKLMSPIPQSSKNRNKAVDTTADIVMEDYKLGDLKDNAQRGDTMAPSLPPKLQKQADNFFAGKKKGASIGGLNTAAIARAAMSGAYRPEATGAINPVAAQHRAKARAPVNVMASYDGKN